MEQQYRYGIDDPIKAARTITVESELEADAVFAHAQAMKHPLPTGYITKARIACNQMDSFRMMVCDWQHVVEVRRENVQTIARVRLGQHLRKAHPYLSRDQVKLLLRVIQFNFRDVGI